MIIDRLKRIKKDLTETTWSERYQELKTGLVILSYIGHIGCIFSSFFLIFNVLTEIENTVSPWIWGVVSVLLLTAYEYYLKRSLLENFSKEYVDPFMRKKSYITGIFSFIMVILSFVMTYQGAQRFSDKTYSSDKELEIKITNLTDSINTKHSVRIYQLETRRKYLDSLSTALQMKATDIIITDNKTSNGSLKKATSISDKFTKDIQGINKEIQTEKALADSEIQSEISRLKDSQSKFLKRNNDNVILFIIILLVTESLIVVGVYFKSLHDYNSSIEYDDMFNSNERIRNFILWDDALDILYGSGVKPVNIGSPVVNPSDLAELCRASNLMLSEQEIRLKMYKMLTALGIIETRGSRRYIKQNIKVAKNLLRKQFKI